MNTQECLLYIIVTLIMAIINLVHSYNVHLFVAMCLLYTIEYDSLAKILSGIPYYESCKILSHRPNGIVFNIYRFTE